MQSVRTGSEPSLIHVAIVEDDPGFSEALSRAVQAAQDMQLVGLAMSRADGLALLQGPLADVLLVDLGLPDGSGIDVIRAAAQQWPSCSIMVSTNFGDETHVMRSIEAGAAGYLLKDSSPARMAEEIRSLASGGNLRVRPRLLRHPVGAGARERRGRPYALWELVAGAGFRPAARTVRSPRRRRPVRIAGAPPAPIETSLTISSCDGLILGRGGR